jgi:hypothetical protein
MSQLLENSAQSEKHEPSRELLERLQTINNELRDETGGVVLFGLFERDKVPGQWDLLVAADWIGPEVTSAVAYVAGKIQESLTPDELTLLAGVVALRPSDPFVRQLLDRTLRVQALGLFKNCTFNGIHIARAWIFAADPHSHSDFQPPPYIAPQPVSAKARIVQPVSSDPAPKGSTGRPKSAAKSKPTRRKR